MSKTNATNVEVKYHVYGTVTICRLTFEVPKIEPFFFYDLKEIISDLGISSELGSNNRITIIGRSKCNPLDTFDEVLGKRIAESRAKLKMFKMLEKINAKAADKLTHFQARCVDAEYNCFGMVQQEQEHLANLLNE